MPEYDDDGIHPNSRSQVVLHERIATIEEQLRSVKEDGRVVRSTLHDVNNNMQLFVAAEKECGKALLQLVELTKDLPTVAAHARDFAEMKVRIQDVIDEQHRRRGAWGAYIGLGTMIIGAATVGAAIATFGMWLHSLH